MGLPRRRIDRAIPPPHRLNIVARAAIMAQAEPLTGKAFARAQLCIRNYLP